MASTTKHAAMMAEVHRRVAAAVGRAVARGCDPRRAFHEHMAELARRWPRVFRAYATWLLLTAAERN